MKGYDCIAESIELLTEPAFAFGAGLPGASRLRIIRQGQDQPTEPGVGRPDGGFTPGVATVELDLG